MAAARWLLGLLVVLLAAAQLGQAQDRIKMCGRELIRLAVSSCGNSRLRRSILDSELSQQQLAAGWDQDASTEEDQASETLQIPSSSLAPHWHPLTFRIRRSAGKISDICCEKGCSMKELIQFC
ncbi:PREDICTED: relaxin-3-like [Poecilia mexicana]|uniref:insulin-like 3 (Leydig cell) n=1 Tax=Poecilia formosa TaxID=48698 RepID=UPI000443ADD6|nr:PREDICTED: relaxin-3-like [Poecilia formosa]XP_014833825.1 PREDICTED: relaxin-3-like [Poecilia mexicana]